MNKKVLIGIGIVIVLLIIGGVFVLSKKNANYQNPQTLEELRASKPNSEYSKCLAEVDANEQKQIVCTRDKLTAQGYSDGIDCIMEFNNPICESIERYNAEVDASNECIDNDPNSLTVLDCTKLIGK